MERTFAPVEGLAGTLRMPADKSIAHRAFLLAGMARGRSRVRVGVVGEDVQSTRRCMQRLGAPSFDEPGGLAIVEGTGWKVPAEAALYCGNSGTTMRLLAGALAGRPGTFELTGDESLSRRPMRRVAEPLVRMGARVETSEAGLPPVTVTGGPLQGIAYRSPVPSAQVKSAILLAGLQASGTTTVEEPAGSRDHTERLLDWLGCRIERSDHRVSIEGGDCLFRHPGFELEVPGDLSSAAFWLVAAALAPKASIRIAGVGLNPGRSGVLEVLRAMGADLQVEASAEVPEPAGAITASSGSLSATEISGATVPRAIDELPILALAATQADGITVIRDAGELRVKETDRIAVLAAGLRTLGAKVEEQPDGMTIEGPTPLTGGVVDAGGDHRMALTFAVAGLVAKRPVTVRGWEAAAVSYPQFPDDLSQVAR